MSMLNVTFNSTQESKQLTNVDVIFVITELVLRLIAVVTNILIVATISASIKQWKYSMGTLMLTLALCDTVLNGIAFIILIVHTFYYSYLLFIMLRYMWSSLEAWSKLLMLAFSVNRYSLVCKPFTHYRITSRKSTVIQIIILAVIAFTTNIPTIFTWTMSNTMHIIYVLMIGFSIVYFIPLIVTFVLTVLVICELNRNHGTLGVSSESTGTRQGERNITKAMVITVMAYILLVLPSAIECIQLFNFNLPRPLIFTLDLLFVINYSINIFIYTLYLPKFRSTLFGIFKCKCCKKVPVESSTIATGPSTSVQMRQLPP